MPTRMAKTFLFSFFFVFCFLFFVFFFLGRGVFVFHVLQDFQFVTCRVKWPRVGKSTAVKICFSSDPIRPGVFKFTSGFEV